MVGDGGLCHPSKGHLCTKRHRWFHRVGNSLHCGNTRRCTCDNVVGNGGPRSLLCMDARSCGVASPLLHEAGDQHRNASEQRSCCRHRHAGKRWLSPHKVLRQSITDDDVRHAFSCPMLRPIPAGGVPRGCVDVGAQGTSTGSRQSAKPLRELHGEADATVHLGAIVPARFDGVCCCGIMPLREDLGES